MILDEFEKWLIQNESKFFCKPYIYKTRNSKPENYLGLRFKNIIPELFVCVNNRELCVWISLENIVYSKTVDLLADFLVEEGRNKEGNYYNCLHSEPRHHYDSLIEVYQAEFDCFLEWINSNVSEKNFVAVAWNGGITSAIIIDPETQPREYEDYRRASGELGLPPTKNETLLSELVNINNKKIISGLRKREWHSRLLSLSFNQ